MSSVRLPLFCVSLLVLAAPALAGEMGATSSGSVVIRVSAPPRIWAAPQGLCSTVPPEALSLRTVDGQRVRASSAVTPDCTLRATAIAADLSAFPGNLVIVTPE